MKKPEPVAFLAAVLDVEALVFQDTAEKRSGENGSPPLR